METFAEFEKLMQDEAIKQEFRDFLADKQPATEDASAQAFVDFAKSKGFDLMKDLETADETGREELSPEALENVSGGGLWGKIKKAYRKSLGKVINAIGEDEVEALPNQGDFWRG